MAARGALPEDTVTRNQHFGPPSASYRSIQLRGITTFGSKHAILACKNANLASQNALLAGNNGILAYKNANRMLYWPA